MDRECGSQAASGLTSERPAAYPGATFSQFQHLCDRIGAELRTRPSHQHESGTIGIRYVHSNRRNRNGRLAGVATKIGVRRSEINVGRRRSGISKIPIGSGSSSRPMRCGTSALILLDVHSPGPTAEMAHYQIVWTSEAPIFMSRLISRSCKETAVAVTIRSGSSRTSMRLADTRASAIVRSSAAS